MSEDLAGLDALAQAELVRRAELSAAELVEAAVERIERLNPQLNAVITPLYEGARQAARTLASAGGAGGPFAGVPFLMKDLMAHTAGDRYCAGMAVLKELDYRPDHDTELAARFRASGLITLGKTNTPEWGSVPTTEPLAFGPTHNPWDLSRSPSGSSGGSAAAVASGMVPMAASGARTCCSGWPVSSKGPARGPGDVHRCGPARSPTDPGGVGPVQPGLAPPTVDTVTEAAPARPSSVSMVDSWRMVRIWSRSDGSRRWMVPMSSKITRSPTSQACP